MPAEKTSYRLLAVLFAHTFASGAYAEWAAEGALGVNPLSYYEENLRKENSAYQMKNTGTRISGSARAQVFYNWIGLRTSADYYFSGNGSQTTTYQNSTGGGQSQSEASGIGFSNATNWTAEIVARGFYYGHREFVAIHWGLRYRHINTDLSNQPADYTAANLVSRYMTFGVQIEPFLTNFSHWELSLPVELSVGLNFPQGGVFDGSGPGSVLLALGLRLQREPRGPFATLQGVVMSYSTDYESTGNKYSFSQTEVALRIMAGYFFKTPTYNE